MRRTTPFLVLGQRGGQLGLAAFEAGDDAFELAQGLLKAGFGFRNGFIGHGRVSRRSGHFANSQGGLVFGTIAGTDDH